MALLSLLCVPEMAPDFWRPSEDYARVEGSDQRFLVPFKGQPGMAPDGTVTTPGLLPG
jgi:hypothetical protein